MTKLVFIGAEGAPEVPIPPAGVTFGRAPDCDLPIQEGSVSGHHGSLRFEGGRWWLHDNNSSNGSFLCRNSMSASSSGSVTKPFTPAVPSAVVTVTGRPSAANCMS